MIDVRKLQKSLGVGVDGIAGIGTFTALFQKIGASTPRASDMAVAANRYFAEYGLMESALRLSHFLAQVGHESGSFRYMEEIWGPTPAQSRYEGREDLGNVRVGDGKLYLGRGPLQVTGRANYRKYGRLIGIDLESNPTLASIPSIGLHTALEYWKQRGLNALADADDVVGITKRVNGGTNGLDDRKARLASLKGWMR